MKKRKPRNFKERLSTGRHYAILRKSESGALLGYIEHSFSMDWSKTEVRIWSFSDLSGYILGFPNKTVHYDKLGTKVYQAATTLKNWCRKNDAFIVRVGSKKCPITIDTSMTDSQKYNYRNKPFLDINWDISEKVLDTE